jgi:hypothetical protein
MYHHTWHLKETDIFFTIYVKNPSALFDHTWVYLLSIPGEKNMPWWKHLWSRELCAQQLGFSSHLTPTSGALPEKEDEILLLCHGAAFKRIRARQERESRSFASRTLRPSVSYWNIIASPSISHIFFLSLALAPLLHILMRETYIYSTADEWTRAPAASLP